MIEVSKTDLDALEDAVRIQRDRYAMALNALVEISELADVECDTAPTMAALALAKIKEVE